MRLSLAFAALVAAVPAFANAVPPRIGTHVPHSKRSGTAIPLTKRAVQMIDEQGVVNGAVLKALGAKTSKKLGRGFLAYERNMGKAHPFAMRVSSDVCGRDDGSGGDPLINDQSVLWHGSISVGTPPVNFTVDFDTGSSDLFLPGTTCGTTCQGHKIYNTAASSTAKDLNKPFTLGFGDGSSVQGEVFTDTVTLAGLTATNQSVGAAAQYSTGFSLDQFPPDGLMGMAFSEISVFGTNTFFESLVAQGGATAPQFSFKLAANESELFLGGSNSDLFTGEFTTLNVTQQGFWQVTLDSVGAGGQQALSNVQAVIDTGTSLIVAPEADVVKFYQAIPGFKDASSTIGQGFFTFPCNSDPQVSLTFGGKQFAVPVSAFNIGPITQGSSDCVGGIMAANGIDFWVVGDVFLTNFYTRFDSGAKQVGFADLA